MKVAFLIRRQNTYKHMAPVIEEALERGWQVDVWLYKGQDQKDYLQVDDSNIPMGLVDRVTARSFVEDSDLQALINSYLPNAIFSLDTLSKYDVVLSRDNLFVLIQHGIDLFVNSKPEELIGCDLICLYSPFWLEWALYYYAEAGHALSEAMRLQIEARVVFTGNAQLDIFPELDPDQIKNEFGLPQDKAIVLMLPVNLTYWPGHWPRLFLAQSRGKMLKNLIKGAFEEGIGFMLHYWYWALLGLNDSRLTQAVRAFCDRNDAYLIIKARKKDPLRPWVDQAADKALFDETYFPSTILKLMRVADLCIHSYSTAALEAAYFGTPSLCIDRPNLKTAAHRLWRTNKVGSAFNYSGVNSWISIPQAIQTLPTENLESFQINVEAQGKFIKNYLLAGDHSACQRILNLVAERYVARLDPPPTIKAQQSSRWPS